MSGDAPAAEVIVVDGPDALTYLDSQCTQDLSGLVVGAELMTFLLDPTGTIVAVALVRRTTDDALALTVPRGTAARAVARLDRFAIRADLVVHAPVPLAAASPFDDLERIDAGIPGAAELARDLVPHAVGAPLRERCVSFTKGCYTGQELVARMQARGATPPYVLRGLDAEAPIAPGDPVGDPAFDGSVTSVVAAPGTEGFLALCVLHRRDAAGPTIEVRTGSGVVVARLR